MEMGKISSHAVLERCGCFDFTSWDLYQPVRLDLLQCSSASEKIILSTTSSAVQSLMVNWDTSQWRNGTHHSPHNYLVKGKRKDNVHELTGKKRKRKKKNLTDESFQPQPISITGACANSSLWQTGLWESIHWLFFFFNPSLFLCSSIYRLNLHCFCTCGLP